MMDCKMYIRNYRLEVVPYKDKFRNLNPVTADTKGHNRWTPGQTAMKRTMEGK